MKVVSATEMSRVEHLAYQSGSLETDFMHEAGKNIAIEVQDYVMTHGQVKRAILLCGKGNNAGDTYVAGLHLLNMGFDVIAWQIIPFEECSPLCQENLRLFFEAGGRVRDYTTVKEWVFPEQAVILDGLFGTGFHGKVEEPYLSLMSYVNASRLPILSVDIPSGLNGTTGSVLGEAIVATETIFLELPKTGFFLQNAWNYVGKLRLAHFGLSDAYIEQAQEDLIMLTEPMLSRIIPPLKRNRHKYQTGLVVGFAGSPGMPGAALLSSLASLRGGTGIVRLLHPNGMEQELSASPYEVIKIAYDENGFEQIIDALNRATATFIGPGIGRSESTKKLLEKILRNVNKPCVIDGDALTLIAEGNFEIPKDAVLTPHHGELARLLKLPSLPMLDLNFLKQCQDFAETHQVTLVMKGAPTFIFHPEHKVLVSPRGDPGMATAGSGDALTGLIAALLAQGAKTREAAALGVYLHGMAGEMAAAELFSRGMIASDIIDHLPEAYRKLSS